MSEEAPRLTMRQRLAEFYRRLGDIPQPSNSEAVLKQLEQTLDQVEDEFSGVVKQLPAPPLGQLDGRMYFPSEDHIKRNADGSILALARVHRIEIDASGHVRIVNKVTNQVEFEK